MGEIITWTFHIQKKIKESQSIPWPLKRTTDWLTDRQSNGCFVSPKCKQMSKRALFLNVYITQSWAESFLVITLSQFSFDVTLICTHMYMYSSYVSFSVVMLYEYFVFGRLFTTPSSSWDGRMNEPNGTDRRKHRLPKKELWLWHKHIKWFSRTSMESTTPHMCIIYKGNYSLWHQQQ